MPLRGAVVIAGCLLVVTSCSSHDTTQEVRPAPQRRTGATASSLPPVTSLPSVTSVPPVTRSASTSFSVPKSPSIAFAVKARNARISVYPTPNANRTPQVLPNPWVVDPFRPEAKAQQAFLIEPGRSAPGWVRVLLPVLPNGTTGWVRWQDVKLQQIDYRVRVEKRAHTITVLNRNNVVYQGPIAIGKASTPTPTGKYYIRALVRAPNGGAAYGPFAFGLSSRSKAMPTFSGDDAEIGIHGNNNASVLGRNITAGSIRMDNEEITQLAGMLPLGTPVDIVA